MRRRHNRGGIERKFVTSILWVAFIPMTLALLIGYVSAREGQQLAVIQNLSTAVQTTAGGIQLALEQHHQQVLRGLRRLGAGGRAAAGECGTLRG